MSVTGVARRILRFISFFPANKLGVSIVLSGIFLLTLASGIYIATGRFAREELAKKILDRESAVVGTGANSIETFLGLLANSVVLQSRNLDFNSKSDMTTALEAFVSDWESTPVKGGLITDKNGKAVLVSDVNGRVSEGSATITDRDYFIWATKANNGEFFLGEPILPRSEDVPREYLVPLTTPIYSNGEFSGTFTVSISLSDLTKSYLIPLKIVDTSEVYLLNSKGVFLHAPKEELIGMSFRDYLEGEGAFLGDKLIGEIAGEKIAERQEGVLDIVFPSLRDGLLTRMLTAYSPVDANGQYWILAMATPANEAFAFIAPFYINQLGLLIVVFLVLHVFVVIFIIKSRLVKPQNPRLDKM